MLISELIQSRSVYIIQHTATAFEAAQIMAEKNIGALAVVNNQSQLVGILSERDIITRVIAARRDPRITSVDSIMTRDLVVAQLDEDEGSCLRKMKAANCRHLPVVSGQTLLGLISLRDLLQIEVSDRDEKLEFLHNYIFRV